MSQAVIVSDYQPSQLTMSTVKVSSRDCLASLHYENANEG